MPIVEEPIFNLFTERISAYVKLRGLELCKTIEEGLKGNCLNAIMEGTKQGEGIYKIRERLRAVIEDYSKVNAERVARTETINACRRATVEGYIQSGVVERARWVAAPTGCEMCQELNGQEFDLTEVPDSPHPNCTCGTMAVLRD